MPGPVHDPRQSARITERRLELLLWLFLLWALAIVGRLGYLQIYRHDDLLKQAQQQQQKPVKIPAMRGSILDRNGQPLAKTLPAETITMNPARIPDAEVAVGLLAPVLGLDREQWLTKIRSAQKAGKRFLRVKRRANADEVARVRGFNLEWVDFIPEMQRYYPQGPLASHVIGSLGAVPGAGDEDEEHGNAGIEQYLDDELSGRPGEARLYTDVRQHAYDADVAREPEPGADLTLTIDEKLQYFAEKELDKAVESSGAHTGSIVAMNPYTGDVLAMANFPRFDPNVPPQTPEDFEARSNLAVATPFEPGSVFKVITLAAALETTQLRPDSVIPCGNGTINLFGRVIHDHDRYSSLSMADVLAKSSNIGAIQIGLKVGDKGLYNYVRKFGFGRKTGIELPGESSGLVRRPAEWTPSSIGSVAMGHEISTTALQLALAGSAVANGGMLVKPRLVLSKRKADGTTTKFPAESAERILNPETVTQMRQMMEGVVLHGTGKRAILKGYTSGGKTGSAQIYDLKAHVYTHTYNASFLGFAPVTNPQIVIVVTLNGTTHGSSGFGGAVAAPVFREVATSALRMLDVPKDVHGDFERVTKGPSNDNDLSIADLGGPPGILAESPNGPGLMRPASIANSGPAWNGPQVVASVVGGVRAPDYRGMTIREVLARSAAAGLLVEAEGNGLVRVQDPMPGSLLQPQARIRVFLGK